MSFDHSNSWTYGQQNRPMWNLASIKDEQFVIFNFDLQTGGQQHWQDHCEDGPQAFAACRSGNFLVIMTMVLTTTMLSWWWSCGNTALGNSLVDRVNNDRIDDESGKKTLKIAQAESLSKTNSILQYFKICLNIAWKAIQMYVQPLFKFWRVFIHPFSQSILI